MPQISLLFNGFLQKWKMAHNKKTALSAKDGSDRVTTLVYLFFTKKTSAGTKIPSRSNGRNPSQPMQKAVGAKLQGHVQRHSCAPFQLAGALCGILCRLLSFSLLLSLAFYYILGFSVNGYTGKRRNKWFLWKKIMLLDCSIFP